MRAMTDEPDHRAHYRPPLQARSAATLARVLEAAEEIAFDTGFEQLTINGVAERAGVSVGSIYRRFDGKDQLVAALTDRMLRQREHGLAERLRTADPSLPGVLHAYTAELLDSFTSTRSLFPSLLRARDIDVLDRGTRTIAEVHRLLLEAAAPHTGAIRRADPRGALDAVARALLGACFHNSVRPDQPTDDDARRRYAAELAEMGLAYLLTPDRPDAPPARDGA